MRLLILNGPNLNLLGKREPGVYGSSSFEDYFEKLKEKFSSFTLTYKQSNSEGELVTIIQDADDHFDGIV